MKYYVENDVDKSSTSFTSVIAIMILYNLFRGTLI